MMLASFVVYQGVGSAAEPETKADDLEAIREATATYVEAVNQGEITAVVEHWTDHGDFIDETGQTAKGRELVQPKLAKDDGSAKLTVKISSIRLTTPDLAIVDGTAMLTPQPQGKPPMSRFTAVWVRRGGRWLLDAVRESAAQAPGHHEYLTELEWMIGDWVADDDEGHATMSCTWSADKNFILREISVSTAGEHDLAISQRIGWDPLTRRIKSWTFDARGGYGESFWARDAEHWIVESKGVLPGGVRVTGTHVYTPIDDRTFNWESIDGRIGETQVPDMTKAFVRKPAAQRP
jgi:uncharacterized protein (TIGR02246 family)